MAAADMDKRRPVDDNWQANTIGNRMRRLIVSIALLLAANPSIADPSLSVARLDCERVQSELRRFGAAILHFDTSGDRTRRNYDRFVSDSRFCDSRQSAVNATIPTADRPDCPVKKCESVY